MAKQKCYHLTVQGPRAHLGATSQSPEGPSLTHLMEEAIINGITEEQGELPLLMSIIKLISTQCPMRSSSQCQRSDGKMIAVPPPYKALLRTLPIMEKSSSGKPSRQILQHLPLGTALSGITHKVPQPQLSPPLKKRSETLTDSPTMPGTIDDQLERALVTSCPKNKRRALRVLTGLCGDPECSE